MELDTTLLDRAIIFAVKAHAGTERRGKGFPYIVHPMEAVEIVATMTTDQELLAAAALHDVVEDTDVTIGDVADEFGDRVAELVASESEVPVEGMSEEASWHGRKQAAIDRLAAATTDAKMVALGDKLSNMRAIARDHAKLGDELWQRFHTTDSAEHEWHYRGLAASLSELADTSAYREFVWLIDRTFTSGTDTFSLEHDGDVLHVTGAIGRDEASALVAELGAPMTVLDFARVTSVDFAALRVLLDCRQDGGSFRVSNASDEVYMRFETTGTSRFISVCRRPREFDMSTVKRQGEGWTAESYTSADGDSMVKLYQASMPQGIIETEKVQAQAVLSCGIPTPLSGDLIKVGDRHGVTFERITGKRSFSRLVADDPDHIEAYAAQFAEACRQLHSTPCDTRAFPSVTEYYRGVLGREAFWPDPVRTTLGAFLDGIDETGRCVHGDLHIGNVIRADGKCLFIDLADFGYGNPDIDLGSMYFTMCFTPEDIAHNLFHLDS
ncbi:MAG: HD domain-containing protein, partial [Atopobiaceae bacterium]|nr:HD domain-containing protein [Atopobiaceae bacterium]